MERYNRGYDDFGLPNRVSNVGNRYLFTGREYDVETGNYYYRARYYEPNIGRFLQPDPIGYAGGLNLYTYCGNNPLNWVDPWGFMYIDPFIESPIYYFGSKPIDTYFPWYDPEEVHTVAMRVQNQLFPPGDPYGGGFRHCLAAALLREKYGYMIASMMVNKWDADKEIELASKGNMDSICDMKAEQQGLSIEGDCLKETLCRYPNTPEIFWNPNTYDPFSEPFDPFYHPYNTKNCWNY